MINVFTKLYFLCATHGNNTALIKQRYFLVPAPGLCRKLKTRARNSLLNGLQNGTNGDFGRVLVPRKLHVYTISSLHYQVVAKREFLRMCFRAKRFLHADAFAVDSYWPVTRTAVGGHFCATQHGGRACKQVRLLRGNLSRCCLNKCIFFLTFAWVQTLRENKKIGRVVIKTLKHISEIVKIALLRFPAGDHII